MSNYPLALNRTALQNAGAEIGIEAQDLVRPLEVCYAKLREATREAVRVAGTADNAPARCPEATVVAILGKHTELFAP